MRDTRAFFRRGGCNSFMTRAAIGPAVNLASRRCDRAWSGQVLVDQRTIGLIGERAKGYTFENLETIELKGFARAI